MKTKTLKTLAFILFVLFTSQPLLLAKAKGPKGNPVSFFEKRYTTIEKQFRRLEKYNAKKAFKKYGRYESSRWDIWFDRWNEKNVSMKSDLRLVEAEFPLLYDQFILSLRSLSVVAGEYRKFFYWEESEIKNLRRAKKTYIDNLDSLRFEIDFFKSKGVYFLDGE